MSTCLQTLTAHRLPSREAVKHRPALVEFLAQHAELNNLPLWIIHSLEHKPGTSADNSDTSQLHLVVATQGPAGGANDTCPHDLQAGDIAALMVSTDGFPLAVSHPLTHQAAHALAAYLTSQPVASLPGVGGERGDIEALANALMQLPAAAAPGQGSGTVTDAVAPAPLDLFATFAERMDQTLYKLSEDAPLERFGLPAHLRLRRACGADTALVLEWHRSFFAEVFDKPLPELAISHAVQHKMQASQVFLLEQMHVQDIHDMQDLRPTPEQQAGGSAQAAGASAMPLAMVSFAASGHGIARISCAYTPAALRGRGLAACAVAGVCAWLRGGSPVGLDDGTGAPGAGAGQGAVLLYADQASAAANRLYEKLGFRHEADMLMLRR